MKLKKMTCHTRKNQAELRLALIKLYSIEGQFGAFTTMSAKGKSEIEKEVKCIFFYGINLRGVFFFNLKSLILEMLFTLSNAYLSILYNSDNILSLIIHKQKRV